MSRRIDKGRLFRAQNIEFDTFELTTIGASLAVQQGSPPRHLTNPDVLQTMAAEILPATGCLIVKSSGRPIE